MKAALLSILGLAMVPTSAAAQQFEATSDVYTSQQYGLASSYTGPGSDFGHLGAVSDGGYDAFDGFGYLRNLNGLALSRQTELLNGQNIYRFFDTLTNSSASTITANVQFWGNLGSDGQEYLLLQQLGLVVTCENSVSSCPSGISSHDPILALVAGNNGLAYQVVSVGQYSAMFTVSVAPGQSVSLLNYAFLARGANGPVASDSTLAITTGQSILSSPIVTGLTAEQQSRVANWSFGAAAVPEPGTWAMMLLGFGSIGFSMRRGRRVKARLQAA